MCWVHDAGCNAHLQKYVRPACFESKKVRTLNLPRKYTAVVERAEACEMYSRKAEPKGDFELLCIVASAKEGYLSVYLSIFRSIYLV